MKEEILKLREEGKSFRQIEEILGCSKSTISYHCSTGQKEKTRDRNRKMRSINPISKKIESFKSRKSLKNRCEKFQMRVSKKSGIARRGNLNKSMKDCDIFFNKNDVLRKFGDHPTCYLTGKNIDWDNPDTYVFDHIIPVSKGGDNSIDNMGVLHPHVNIAKQNLSVEELLALCVDILSYNGYYIEKRI